MTRIAVLDEVFLNQRSQREINKLAGAELDYALERTDDVAELVRRTGDAVAVLVSPWAQLSADYFAACPAVRYVGLCGTSTANVALEATSQVQVANVSHYGDVSTAEFMMMQLLMLARGFGPYQWKDAPCELRGKRLGVLGLGDLGQAVAHLTAAFGMITSYYSRTRKLAWESDTLTYQPLDELLATNDIVVVCTPTNVPVLGAKEFALLPPGSVVVQLSIGDVLDYSALAQWVGSGANFAIIDRAAGAHCCEVVQDLPHVIVTPVTAAYSQEVQDRLSAGVLSNLTAFFATQ